ncbi:hypothetical protein [Shimia biformata]|uniref:hypothetical protein n=1 Tax=Shimia biformata TaxID=1294299 RepID=UPI00194FFFC5|nr:hypothetical protein [Shimia biformata]
MKTIIVSAITLTLATGAAYAGGNKNSEARAMADFLSNGGGTLGGAINPEKGNNGKGTASDVSGGGNGGWGNIGSTLTGEPGESVSGR